MNGLRSLSRSESISVTALACQELRIARLIDLKNESFALVVCDEMAGYFELCFAGPDMG